MSESKLSETVAEVQRLLTNGRYDPSWESKVY